jgi:hypothetical protein
MVKEYHKRRALNSYRRYKHMKSVVNRAPWMLKYGGGAGETYKTRMMNALSVARYHHKIYKMYP